MGGCKPGDDVSYDLTELKLGGSFNVLRRGPSGPGLRSRRLWGLMPNVTTIMIELFPCSMPNVQISAKRSVVQSYRSPWFEILYLWRSKKKSLTDGLWIIYTVFGPELDGLDDDTDELEMGAMTTLTTWV